MDSQLNVVNKRLEIPITDSVLKRMARNASTELDANGCRKWIGPQRNGYGVVNLHGNTFSAHYLSFVLSGGQLTEGHVVSHKCDVKTCVNPDHLELVTIESYKAQANAKRARNAPRGEELSSSVLTLNDVLNIKIMYEPGVCSYRKIAKKLGLNPDNVKNVVYGNTWKHVPIPACASHASS